MRQQENDGETTRERDTHRQDTHTHTQRHTQGGRVPDRDTEREADKQAATHTWEQNERSTTKDGPPHTQGGREEEGGEWQGAPHRKGGRI